MRFEHQRIIPLYCATINVLSSDLMSYHRVLPPPLALTNQNHSRSWFIEPEALLQPMAMANEKDNDNREKSRSPASSEKSSSPAAERVSPSVESMEDYEDPPKTRKRSSSQASSGDTTQWQRHFSSTSKGSPMSWQGESPSQICLCQPDPKVPRPRNGTQYLFVGFIHYSTLYDHLLMLFITTSTNSSLQSIHSIPPTSSSYCSLTESRSCKS